VVNSPPSNVSGFLSRDTCVSSTQLHRPIWNKMCVFNFEIPVWQPIFLSKTNSMLTENALHSKHSSIDGFLSTDTCVSSTQLNRLVRNIEHLSPL
jgi:hypothetical protein